MLVPALMLAATSAAAQTDPRSAADSAKAFSLDLATPATPAPQLPAANPDAPVPVAFTLDTPIAQLIADAHAKAVLDRDMPGLSGDSNLPKFQSMSLRQFQPMTGGQMSDTLLAKVGSDLAAIGSQPELVPMAPPSASPATHKRMEDGR